jgi:hypothetical protein
MPKTDPPRKGSAANPYILDAVQARPPARERFRTGPHNMRTAPLAPRDTAETPEQRRRRRQQRAEGRTEGVARKVSPSFGRLLDTLRGAGG